MMEDKLNTEQRIRLEAVAQSIAKNGPARMEKVLADAQDIAAFVSAGDMPAGNN